MKHEFDIDTFIARAVKSSRQARGGAVPARRAAVRRVAILRRRIDLYHARFGLKPGPEGSVLRAADFAAAMVRARGGSGNEPRVLPLARMLAFAADKYFDLAEAEVGGEAKRGRPPDTADLAFVRYMARIYAAWSGRKNFGWRRYDGREQQTAFQDLCNLWLEQIHPEREKPIGAAIFKKAKLKP